MSGFQEVVDRIVTGTTPGNADGPTFPLTIPALTSNTEKKDKEDENDDKLQKILDTLRGKNSVGEDLTAQENNTADKVNAFLNTPVPGAQQTLAKSAEETATQTQSAGPSSPSPSMRR